MLFPHKEDPMDRPDPVKVIAEYLWLDGHAPTKNVRSKWKVIDGPVTKLGDVPDWQFDGSSTEQAPGDKSDCALKPVAFYPDPVRGAPHVLVMCEVMLASGKPHPSNTRAALRPLAELHASREPLFGIEQEYTLLASGRVAGWPKRHDAYPRPQGRYYCAVGAENVAGRALVEGHMRACLAAGLAYCGGNAEVLLGQWEYQIGAVGPLEAADHLWVARWLLERLGEDHGLTVTLDPKPVKGDWNGTGAHTNFSTVEMRAEGGIKAIEAACERLRARHGEHIALYGAGNEERLTGKHETCSIREFRWGVSDRGASIRIPLGTAKAGRGYLEDRRPAANADPYLVCAALLETVCGSPRRPGRKSRSRRTRRNGT
jgi:glutamine synthetase